jgi:putative hemolysin
VDRDFGDQRRQGKQYRECDSPNPEIAEERALMAPASIDEPDDYS